MASLLRIRDNSWKLVVENNRSEEEQSVSAALRLGFLGVSLGPADELLMRICEPFVGFFLSLAHGPETVPQMMYGIVCVCACMCACVYH